MIPDCRLDVTGSPIIRSTAWLDAIIHDDCFRVLPEMPDKSVDAVITDPPYGVTGNHWDIAPNLPLLWKELRRVCKGRIVIIATQPFATDVINSNRENFKWDDVWVKPPSSVLNTDRPLRSHENILVFERGEYNPQPIEAAQLFRKIGQVKNMNSKLTHKGYGGIEWIRTSITETGERLPRSVFYFARMKNNQFTRANQSHPTEKPLPLMSYLVATFTNPGNIVLDPFAGTGSCCLAAHQLNRQFIGIEKEQEYVDIANKRLAQDVLPLDA